MTTNGHPIWAARLATSLGLACALGSAACSTAVELGAQSRSSSSGGISGSAVTGSSTSGAGDGASGGAGGATTSGGAGGATGSPYTGPAVSCSTPAGTIQVLSSLPEIYAVLEGDWQLCPPTLPDVPADAIGIRFGPGSSAPRGSEDSVGGPAYFLVQGPNGPVPGTGSAYQLTYDVSDEGGYYFQFNIHTSNGGLGGGFNYSPSPREFEFDVDVNPGLVLLTAL